MNNKKLFGLKILANIDQRAYNLKIFFLYIEIVYGLVGGAVGVGVDGEDGEHVSTLLLC